MGYNTRYVLDVKGEGPVMEQFNEDVENDKTFGSYGLELGYLINGDIEPMKWYEYNSDMLALSLEYPNLLFVLDGEGEDSGDIWRAWYRNGKTVEAKARIVIDIPEDLDTLLPVDYGLEEKRKQEERDRLQATIDMLKAKMEAI